jgi:hypothetical protein
MSETTTRFGLPFILPGQAQKELFHNEALALVDAALHVAVEGAPLDVPPDSPALGQAWLVGAGATGAWSGRSGSIATWTSGGWRFIAPVPGMLAWNRAEGHFLFWTGGSWTQGELPVGSLTVGGKKVVGERQPAVPSPSGGTIIDEEARAAIAALTATLKSHGLTE